MDEPDKVVKCCCGSILRRRAWPSHWRSCRQGGTSPDPVTADDVRALELYEARMLREYGIDTRTLD